ncbi:conserved protein of unknown function [Streptomyces murinus]
MAGRLVRDEAGDEIRRHGLEHRVRAELGVVGEDHHLRGGLHERPVDGRGEHVGGGQSPFGRQTAPGQERLRHPQPLEGLLGTGADERVVGAAQGAAGHDDLHPVRMGQRLCDQEGVGDHRETGHTGEPAGQLLRGRTGTDHDRLALFDEAGREIGDRRLLGGREMRLLRETGLPGEPTRQYGTAVPAVEESFRLQCPHVPPYGHFGGLDDAGELTERHGTVRSHHFEDQLATFSSEHETDSNPSDRLLSAVCAD